MNAKLHLFLLNKYSIYCIYAHHKEWDYKQIMLWKDQHQMAQLDNLIAHDPWKWCSLWRNGLS